MPGPSSTKSARSAKNGDRPLAKIKPVKKAARATRRRKERDGNHVQTSQMDHRRNVPRHGRRGDRRRGNARRHRDRNQNRRNLSLQRPRRLHEQIFARRFGLRRKLHLRNDPGTGPRTIAEAGRQRSNAGNIAKQARDIRNFAPGMLLPGITIDTDANKSQSIAQLQLQRWNGTTYERFGGILSATSN